jgi:hypothetical protein
VAALASLPLLQLSLGRWLGGGDTQAIISPPKTEAEGQEQANAILKFLPLMIGWFALNVPSGLTLYWLTNNILTTSQQVSTRRFPSQRVVARTRMYTHAASVWDSPLVQGPFLSSPCQTPCVNDAPLFATNRCTAAGLAHALSLSLSLSLSSLA